MKTIFVIAGLDIHKTAAHEDFAPLIKGIQAKGYRTVPVNITWRQTTPSQYAHKFIKLYSKNKGSGENIVIGNSFGAIVAFLTAAQLKPSLVVLCSLSPFFMEDCNEDWPPSRYNRLLGARRLKDIRQYSAQTIAHDINQAGVKFKVLYGQKEHQTSPKLVKRAKATARELKYSELIEVANAPHPFKEPKYIAGILKEL